MTIHLLLHAPPTPTHLLESEYAGTCSTSRLLGRLLQISELCVQFLEQNQFIRQSCRRSMSGLSGEFKNVRFSNRPVWVHLQAVHDCGGDVARGLVLLFGIHRWLVCRAALSVTALAIANVPSHAVEVFQALRAFASMRASRRSVLSRRA